MGTVGEGERSAAAFKLRRRLFCRPFGSANVVLDPRRAGLECITDGLEEAEGVSGAQEFAQEQSTPTVELYPKERVKLNWCTMRSAGAGLFNPDSLCFLNAGFQLLFHTAPFANWCEEELGTGHSNKGEWTGRVLRLYSMTKKAKQPVIAREFHKISVIRQICGSFRRGRMEDTTEWIMGVLGKLHDEFLKRKLPGTAGKCKPDVEHTSFMYQIFGGELQSQVKCKKEKFKSNTIQSTTTLEVELGKAKTLEGALGLFTGIDKLVGDNKYKLQWGTGKDDFKMVNATKQLTIKSAPNVLMIVLKRFPVPELKISRKIKFGRILDLAGFVSNPVDGENYRYTLSGVIVHAGMLVNSGHYYTYARAPNGIWHEFNDEMTRTVSEKTVLDAEAYVLCYIKQSTQKTSVTAAKPQRKPIGNPPAKPLACKAANQPGPLNKRTAAQSAGLPQRVIPQSVVQKMNGKRGVDRPQACQGGGGAAVNRKAKAKEGASSREGLQEAIRSVKDMGGGRVTTPATGCVRRNVESMEASGMVRKRGVNGSCPVTTPTVKKRKPDAGQSELRSASRGVLKNVRSWRHSVTPTSEVNGNGSLHRRHSAPLPARHTGGVSKPIIERNRANKSGASTAREVAPPDAVNAVDWLLNRSGNCRRDGAWDSVEQNEAVRAQKMNRSVAPKRKLLDDYNEEYDRGKTKKIRKQRLFDPVNKFQDHFDSRK